MTTLTLEYRIDQLSEQVAYLVEEQRMAALRREKWGDLVHTAQPIARQAMDVTVAELAELDMSIEDAVSFLRRLTEALPTLEAGLGQLEAVAELARQVSELGRPVLDTATTRLAELDERGYFGFVRAGAGVMDRVVTSFSEEDVAALGDNIVLILDTVKQMTQPEVMGMLRRTIHTVQEEEPGEPPSLLSLVREMRDPQVRRGLSRLLAALRSMGQDN